VAITKVDLPNINIEKAKSELQKEGLKLKTLNIDNYFKNFNDFNILNNYKANSGP